MREKYRRDYLSGMYSAWMEGYERGLNRVRTVRRLLEAGESLDAICRTMGLSPEKAKEIIRKIREPG